MSIVGRPSPKRPSFTSRFGHPIFLTTAILIAAAFAAPTHALQASSASPQRETTTVSPADIEHARALSRVFQSVATRLEPSVVHITQFNRVVVRRGFFDSGEVQVRQTGLGSGVLVSADGFILTNNHVISQAEQLKVKLSDGREFPAKKIGGDPLTDVAVIKIDATDLTPADFADSDTLEVGEWVVAIGSPFGFANTVTSGIVSAKGRTGIQLPGQEGGYQDFIQTDAAINPGNSGGPLLNLEGKVVGVNSAIATRTGAYEGIGFAIPANMARTIMDSLIKTGQVTRGFLGIIPVDLESSKAEALGVRGSGVVVDRVVVGSPADKAGLKRGDVILRFQGRPVDQAARFRTAISVTPPGTEAKLDILRDRNPLALTIPVGTRAAIDVASYTGVRVQTLTTSIARQMGYRGIRGVIVRSVEPGSPADRSGLQENDIIEQVAQVPVTSDEEFVEALSRTDLSQGVRLVVIRGEQRGFIVLEE
jgi:serine protease Do